MAIELSTLEESVAPDGWTCQWDKYVTFNLLRLWTNKMFHNKRIKNHIIFILFNTSFRRGFICIEGFKHILEECRVLLTFDKAIILYKG